MADAKKCDRCGAFYFEKLNEESGVIKYVKICRDDDRQDKYKKFLEHFDLCEDCALKLDRFMMMEEESETVTLEDVEMEYSDFIEKGSLFYSHKDSKPIGKVKSVNRETGRIEIEVLDKEAFKEFHDFEDNEK